MNIVEGREEISFSCGMCGAPCNKDGEILPIPENYNPYDYEHDYCIDCGNEELAKQENMVRVTREMALDAQCPEMEGTWIHW